MHHAHWSRRELLIVGGRIAAGSLLLASLPESPEAQAQEAINWRNDFSQMPAGGAGKVKELTGIAFANQRLLKVGDIVRSGEQLRVTKGSQVALHGDDNAIFSMRGEAVMDYHSSSRKTGLINVVLGSLLAVVPKGHRYLVQGPTATIGIKGTVIFREIFREDVLVARAMKGKTYTRPKELTDYFCTCNGAVDYLRNQDRSVVSSDTAEVHSSFFLDPRNPKLLSQAPMINHFDKEIEHMIDLQEGEKHYKGFLYKM